MKKVNALCAIIVMAVCILIICFSLTSCNVTRIVTTEAQHIAKGDTTVTIVTKTTETYDAKKH